MHHGNPSGCSFNPTVIQEPVGGIAELPDAAGAPLEAPDSSGSSIGMWVVVAAGVVGGALALGGAGWYVRRRRIA